MVTASAMKYLSATHITAANNLSNTVMSVTAVGMNYLQEIAYLGHLELRTAVTATPGAPKHQGAPYCQYPQESVRKSANEAQHSPQHFKIDRCLVACACHNHLKL